MPEPALDAVDFTAYQLRLRYIVALSLIALLTLVSQWVIQRTIADQDHDSRIVNIAGRQRMLSQKIAKTCYYLAGAAGPQQRLDFRSQLKQALQLWQRSHDGLQHGDEELGLPGSNSAEVMALFQAIEPHYQAMVAAVDEILAAPAADTALLQQANRRISEHEPSFLRGMDAIVFRYDDEAKGRVDFAKGLEVWLALVTLLVLALEAMLIFAPAVRRLRLDMRNLEQAKEALRESNSFSESLIRNIPFGMDIVDQQGKVLFMNGIMANAIGKPALGEKCWRLYKDDQQQCPDCPLEKPIQLGETRSLEVANLLGGRVCEITHTGMSYRGEHAILEVFQDITERKQAEETRSALETQLRESQKMEAIGTLAGGVAHDFNNLLAMILGNVELARHDLAANPEALLSLEEIDKAAQRAKLLVQQILTFSRRQPHELVSQPLRPAVEEALRLMRATLPAGVELAATLADAPLNVRCDAVQIQQILMNLCTNSWHAMAGNPGRIEIGLEQLRLDAATAKPLEDLTPGAYARLWVSDSGCGMDEATLARIFEPFYTTKTVGQGTGLGLSVVHGIVKEHLGAIEVQSAPGKGTLVAVYLPIAEASPAIDQPLHEPGTEIEPEPEPEPKAARGNGQRVLYVDDEESLVLLVKRMLDRLGYRTCGYAKPQEAIDAVRAAPHEFDLVVSDFNMPGKSGLDVAKEVRRIRADLPVMITTGYITEKLRADALQAGVRHVVYKPNTVEELCQIIHRLFSA